MSSQSCEYEWFLKLGYKSFYNGNLFLQLQNANNKFVAEGQATKQYFEVRIENIVLENKLLLVHVQSHKMF